MANVNITAFQLMRKRQQEEEKRRANELAQEEETTAAEAEPKASKYDFLKIDVLSINEVKKILEELGVKYPPKTGEAKLKERLKDAISGAN